MPRCPVCEAKNTALLCSHCGFDGSCDFERYPSLGRFAGTMDSVRCRADALREKEKNILRCPKCGCSQLSLNIEKQQCCCSNCRHMFPFSFAPTNATPEKTKTPIQPVRLNTSEIRSKSSKPTPKTVPCSPWGNRTLCLGNVLIWMMLATLVFFCPYYIISRSLAPAVGIKQVALPLTVMLLTVMMMQFNLKKKGVICPKWLEWIWEFSGINSNSGRFRWLKAFANILLVPFLMIKLIYPGLLVFFMGYFMGILGPIACIADFATGRSSIQECLLQMLISMTFLYLALWHTVKLAHR